MQYNIFNANQHSLLSSDRGLAETSTFRPFMGELIPLLVVTGRTSEYKVIRAVRAAITGNRNKMFEVISILSVNLLEFLLTVVALVLLPLHLILDLFRGVFPWNRFSKSAVIMLPSSEVFPVCLSILLLFLIDLVAVYGFVHSFIHAPALSVFYAVLLLSLSNAVFVDHFVLTDISLVLFLMCFPVKIVLLSSANFTDSSQSMLSSWMLFKILYSCKLKLFAFRALLVAVWDIGWKSFLSRLFSLARIFTYSALRIKPTAGVSSDGKMLRSCRKSLFAYGTFFKAFRNDIFGFSFSSISFSAISVGTFFAIRSHTVRTALCWTKVLSGSKLDFFAFSTPLVTLRCSIGAFLFAGLSGNFTSAHSALRAKSVRQSFYLVEILRSGGKELFASCALLQRGIDGVGYTSIHNGNLQLSVITTSDIASIAGSNHIQLPLQYSTSPLLKPVYGTFFSSKSEVMCHG